MFFFILKLKMQILHGRSRGPGLPRLHTNEKVSPTDIRTIRGSLSLVRMRDSCVVSLTLGMHNSTFGLGSGCKRNSFLAFTATQQTAAAAFTLSVESLPCPRLVSPRSSSSHHRITRPTQLSLCVPPDALVSARLGATGSALRHLNLLEGSQPPPHSPTLHHQHHGNWTIGALSRLPICRLDSPSPESSRANDRGRARKRDFTFT
jgi:hypothetical protein